MKGLARETLGKKVLGHDDSAIFVVSFQNMSQHLSFFSSRFAAEWMKNVD